MKKISLLLTTFLLLSISWGQIPPGYYADAEGKTKEGLRIALNEIISNNYKQRTYSQLWTDFYTTDARPDDKDKVWDMYSNCNFTFGADQDNGTLGNKECDWYNREHSVPNSWFGGQIYPMYSDLFHIYPVDKYVNAQRENFPYGETNFTGNIYGNGSKRGVGTQESGYTGVVFEPIDEYKGDFARTYLYMATRYIDVDFTRDFGSVTYIFDNATCNLTDYAVNLLLKWHRNDPVSKKEIDRNNAVYGIQNNRNPYIDYPELAEHIWGNLQGTPFSLDIDEDLTKSSIKIIKYPNGIKIDGAAPNSSIEIYSIIGQNVYRNFLNNDLIFLGYLNRGVYIVKIDNYVEKFVW